MIGCHFNMELTERGQINYFVKEGKDSSVFFWIGQSAMTSLMQ